MPQLPKTSGPATDALKASKGALRKRVYTPIPSDRAARLQTGKTMEDRIGAAYDIVGDQDYRKSRGLSGTAPRLSEVMGLQAPKPRLSGKQLSRGARR